MTRSKNILVAPLNWGIGHATRCIPIIKELQNCGFQPIIASDGIALELLQKEFPKLETIVLPSYNISYPKNGNFLKWKLLFNIPTILKSVKKEQKIVQELVKSKKLIGIISDNRFGVRSDKVPSVYITHQVNVLSGFTTFLTSKIHQKIINKFDEYWIPDVNESNYSGRLLVSKKIKNSRFIGILSRFQKKETSQKYDLLILLSGIEPLRTQLEKKLTSELKNYTGNVLFVKGKIENKQKFETKNNITFCNYLLSEALENAINESKLIICRSGYSTIMDLAVLGKKAFFIPTTGQNEQEYLAKHLEELNIAPFSSEEKFKLELLENVKNYAGFSEEKTILNKKLFDLFQGK